MILSSLLSKTVLQLDLIVQQYLSGVLQRVKVKISTSWKDLVLMCPHPYKHFTCKGGYSITCPIKNFEAPHKQR